RSQVVRRSAIHPSAVRSAAGSTWHVRPDLGRGPEAGIGGDLLADPAPDMLMVVNLVHSRSVDRHNRWHMGRGARMAERTIPRRLGTWPSACRRGHVTLQSSPPSATEVVSAASNASGGGESPTSWAPAGSCLPT